MDLKRNTEFYCHAMPYILNMICVFINCVLTAHPTIELDIFEHRPINFFVFEIVDWLVGWIVCFCSSTFYVSCKLNKARNEAQIFTAKLTTTITIKCDMCVKCSGMASILSLTKCLYRKRVENVHARTRAKKIQEKQTQSQKSAQFNQRNEGKTPKTITNSSTIWNAAINIGHKSNQIEEAHGWCVPMLPIAIAFRVYASVCALSLHIDRTKHTHSTTYEPSSSLSMLQCCEPVNTHSVNQPNKSKEKTHPDRYTILFCGIWKFDNNFGSSFFLAVV